MRLRHGSCPQVDPLRYRRFLWTGAPARMTRMTRKNLSRRACGWPCASGVAWRPQRTTAPTATV